MTEINFRVIANVNLYLVPITLVISDFLTVELKNVDDNPCDQLERDKAETFGQNPRSHRETYHGS